jgi:hypothetical protein
MPFAVCTRYTHASTHAHARREFPCILATVLQSILTFPYFLFSNKSHSSYSSWSRSLYPWKPFWMLNFFFFLIPALAETTPVGGTLYDGLPYYSRATFRSLSSVLSLFLATPSVYPSTEMLPSGSATFLLYTRRIVCSVSLLTSQEHSNNINRGNQGVTRSL